MTTIQKVTVLIRELVDLVDWSKVPENKRAELWNLADEIETNLSRSIDLFKELPNAPLH